MASHQHHRHGISGFTLVEIMVGLTIGMLAVLAIMQTYVGFEGQKRTTTSGSDAQTNGAIALHNVVRDVRIAGFGFGVAGALGCTINRSYNGANPGALVLAPVTITNGAGNLPDTIRILASSAGTFSIPNQIAKDHPAQATNFFLNATVGLTENDLVVVYEPGKECTLIQVTGVFNNPSIQIHHQSTSPWNPPGGQNIFPPSGYSKGSMLFNMGNMLDRSYSIDPTPAGGLRQTTFNSATNTSSTVTLVPHIINLQALYGKDTNNDGDVDAWDNTTPATSAAWQQILAVKLVLVSRSTQWEKTSVTAGTGSLAWSESGIPLQVDVNPDGSANADWARYRYKVFETIIPLRNMIWRQS